MIIGVTGSLGTGKSTVARMFKKLGAKVLDADKITHEALGKGTTSYRKVVKEFGSGVLGEKGRIERAKLADMAFYNKRALKKLCGIIHPVVLKKIKSSVNATAGSGGAPAVVIDAPLLIETGLHKIADYLVVVKTSMATQLKRAAKKTGLSYSEISGRIRNQMPLSKKMDMADYIIDNEGPKDKTRKMVNKIWEGMKSGGK